ncbi:MAG TPA: FkbM family methyltransferase [Solirubrobacteraceae bacterium]|nr:FkbM family methyltransferase [Solirubrobacteraceae bacterium]
MSLHDRANSALLKYTPLGDRARRKRLVHARRRLFEARGSARYSRPAHDGIDAKLQRHLPGSGVFLEAGANDGYTWSNTYYLARFCGWRGVLVEPIPELYRECLSLRRESVVLNCALVAPDFPDDWVTMTYSDLRSLIKDSDAVMQERARIDAAGGYEVRVPARTLDQVLDEAGVAELDFVSLDLEGFEAPALSGLDLDLHRPGFLLVETAGGDGRTAVEGVLGERYEALESLTADDVLYRRR